MSRPLICLAALLLAAPAWAQSIGEPIPGRADPLARKLAPAAPRQNAARPCPEYGPGFVRLEGSSACIRAGGSVRAEYGKAAGGRSGSNVSGVVRLEARDETSFGSVRVVAQKRIDSGNWDRGPYR